MASDAAPSDPTLAAACGPPRGLLIAFEGIDGCGKSTQAALLARTLVRRGVPVGPPEHPGAVIREPGGTPLGEGVRELLLHRDHAVGPWAEALLYAAARSQLAHDVLHPALAAGRVLVLDRYIDSSLAYQGHARGLGIDAVLEVNIVATGGLLPDLTIVLDVPPAVAAARRRGTPDRIEAEGDGLQALVAAGYAELAERFPGRVRLVAGHREASAVAAAVEGLVLPLVGRYASAGGPADARVVREGS